MAKLYGVGVGPGDPALITLKAKEVIEKADVICVPKATQEGASIALKIIEPFIKDQRILEVTMPMTKDKEKLREAWQNAASEVAKIFSNETGGRFSCLAKTIVFPTLGDVTIYSTFGYLADEVKKLLPEVEIEMIPGVTSFSAAAARLGIRLAEGSEPLVIIPDAEADDIEDLIGNFQNIVLMKVSAYWKKLKDITKNKKFRTALVSRVSQENENIITDIETMQEKPDYLTLAIIKKD